MKRLIYITLCVTALVGCLRRTHDVPSSSMAPTVPAGSKVTIDYSAYLSMEPKRYDIVAFFPYEQSRSVFILRVIGLPGETVTLTDETVLINGMSMSPPNALRYTPVDTGINQTNLTATQFFLVGDNTADANDSRYLGPIEREKIFGKVMRIEPSAGGDGIPPPQP